MKCPSYDSMNPFSSYFPTTIRKSFSKEAKLYGRWVIPTHLNSDAIRSSITCQSSSVAKTTDLSLLLSLSPPQVSGILVEIADGSGSNIAVGRR